jgi:hypothetical protein
MPSSAGYSGNANLSYLESTASQFGFPVTLTATPRALSAAADVAMAGWGLHGPLYTGSQDDALNPGRSREHAQRQPGLPKPSASGWVDWQKPKTPGGMLGPHP